MCQMCFFCSAKKRRVRARALTNVWLCLHRFRFGVHVYACTGIQHRYGIYVVCKRQQCTFSVRSVSRVVSDACTCIISHIIHTLKSQHPARPSTPSAAPFLSQLQVEANRKVEWRRLLLMCICMSVCARPWQTESCYCWCKIMAKQYIHIYQNIYKFIHLHTHVGVFLNKMPNHWKTHINIVWNNEQNITPLPETVQRVSRYL